MLIKPITAMPQARLGSLGCPDTPECPHRPAVRRGAGLQARGYPSRQQSSVAWCAGQRPTAAPPQIVTGLGRLEWFGVRRGSSDRAPHGLHAMRSRELGRVSGGLCQVSEAFLGQCEVSGDERVRRCGAGDIPGWRNDYQPPVSFLTNFVGHFRIPHLAGHHRPDTKQYRANGPSCQALSDHKNQMEAAR